MGSFSLALSTVATVAKIGTCYIFIIVDSFKFLMIMNIETKVGTVEPAYSGHPWARHLWP